MTTYAATTMPTPVGPFTMIASNDSVIAAGFSRSATELNDQLRHPVEMAGVMERGDLGELSRAVERYLAGDLDAIDVIPVAQRGSPFQQSAWQVLRSIPAGQTMSYREVAARTGVGSARAAGSACGRNAVTLFVPCHRVVRTGGELGGYFWGLDIKRWLLEHERRVA
jgi:O-6-methylguanine DNA methyltransferase